MKKIITIIILLSIIYAKEVNAQPPIDTLLWLKTNIEAKSSFFKGKHFNVLLDSLKGYKKAIKEYSGPTVPGLGLNKVDTLWVDQFDLYFEPLLSTLKLSLHTNCFFSNHLNDTVNTHIKFIKVKFQNKVLFLLKWWSYDRLGLGSHKWSRRLEVLYSKGIIESVSVGEY